MGREIGRRWRHNHAAVYEHQQTKLQHLRFTKILIPGIARLRADVSLLTACHPQPACTGIVPSPVGLLPGVESPGVSTAREARLSCRFFSTLESSDTAKSGLSDRSPKLSDIGGKRRDNLPP